MQLLNTIVSKIQFHLKEVKFLENLFHNVFEKDSLLEASLRKASKITQKVLYQGTCKRNVFVAVAIFHEFTSAAFISYFTEKKNEPDFLKL